MPYRLVPRLVFVAMQRSRYIAVGCIGLLLILDVHTGCLVVACLWVLIGCRLLVVALPACGMLHRTCCLCSVVVVFIAVFLDIRNLLELFMDSKARTCVDSWLDWLL